MKRSIENVLCNLALLITWDRLTRNEYIEQNSACSNEPSGVCRRGCYYLQLI